MSYMIQGRLLANYARFRRFLQAEDLKEAKRRGFYRMPNLKGMNRWDRKQAIAKAKREAVKKYRAWWNEIGAGGRMVMRAWMHR